MVIFGTAHRKGEYDGKAYDNIIVSCMRDPDPYREEEGSIAEVLKVPTSVYNSSGASIGDTIEPMYDKYGRIVKLIKA